MIVVHLVGAVGIAHGGLELGHLGGQRADRPDAVHDLGHGAAAGHVADILAEIADRDAAIDRDLALVGLLLADDHAKQRRLAGAVRADEPDLLAALERRRRLDEDDLLAVLLADAFETDHDEAASLRKTVAGAITALCAAAKVHPHDTTLAERHRRRHARLAAGSRPTLALAKWQHIASIATQWHNVLGTLPAGLTIASGDTVITETIDAAGVDKDGVRRASGRTR